MLPLSTDEANLREARAFVLARWQERALEFGREQPKDLAGACKFASLFAQALFGGELRGNADHQFVVIDEVVVDLTSADGVEAAEPYHHDPVFWGNPEHRASLDSCRPRVARWLVLWEGLHAGAD